LNPAFEEGLARVRRARRAVFFIWLGFLPVVATVPALAELLRFDTNETIRFVGPAYMALLALAALRLSFLRCQRCGNRFYLRLPWFVSALTSKCLHCGVPASDGRLT
jgi:hypothetical protein